MANTVVKTDRKIINRILNKAVEQILPDKETLEKKLLSGEKLNIYQGFDPTAPTLHIGHTVGMRKLEDFRNLGHNVIFLIGDFTARIGDPSDKTEARSSARKVLTEDEIAENLKHYVEQASHIIDIDNKENPVKIMYNSTWLEKLDFGDIIKLASEFTVQQMIKRSMFQKRLEEDKPIYLNEFMYPLMQGYDSVMMDIDVEVGGNDQLFNMLAGRDMVRNHLNKEKIVVAGKLLTTAQGDKMGKSEGNMIKLSDSPEDIYGKVMAFTDEQIVEGFEILTNAPMEEVEDIKEKIESGENPMIFKKQLALKVTSELKGQEAGQKAQEYFETIFQKKSLEAEIKEVKVEKQEYNILDLMIETKLAPSKSQGRRLIEQNAVSIDDEKVTDWQKHIKLTQPIVVKVGKKILKITKQK
ncbi:MAG: tyrosyl-tRNA synthetase [candidate division WS6 bacterium 34_10]|uniref:Tyrosine--tRNA ligase n=1 Tax=candidate division WS6 bacterium 34_10 TaxID=1641389 RepID=A0A101HGY8_9BACT|nr:MAG: tyrosyl-tRNA synthetase [candidate division WS6 bacterium 34_10]